MVDIIVGGGAQDRQQEIVMRDLQGEKAQALQTKLDGGTTRSFHLWLAPTFGTLL